MFDANFSNTSAILGRELFFIINLDTDGLDSYSKRGIWELLIDLNIIVMFLFRLHVEVGTHF